MMASQRRLENTTDYQLLPDQEEDKSTAGTTIFAGLSFPEAPITPIPIHNRIESSNDNHTIELSQLSYRHSSHQRDSDSKISSALLLSSVDNSPGTIKQTDKISSNELLPPNNENMEASSPFIHPTNLARLSRPNDVLHSAATNTTTSSSWYPNISHISTENGSSNQKNNLSAQKVVTSVAAAPKIYDPAQPSRTSAVSTSTATATSASLTAVDAALVQQLISENAQLQQQLSQFRTPSVPTVPTASTLPLATPVGPHTSDSAKTQGMTVTAEPVGDVSGFMLQQQQELRRYEELQQHRYVQDQQSLPVAAPVQSIASPIPITSPLPVSSQYQHQQYQHQQQYQHPPIEAFRQPGPSLETQARTKHVCCGSCHMWLVAPYDADLVYCPGCRSINNCVMNAAGRIEPPQYNRRRSFTAECSVQ